MKHPRFTVRWLMIATAMVALIMWVDQLLQLRAYYLQLVAHNVQCEAIGLKTELGWKERLAALQDTSRAAAATKSEIDEARRSVGDAEAMKVLYSKRLRISERLASHPPPDPLDRRADYEEPIMIFEPVQGLAYHLSTGSIAVLAFASVLVVAGPAYCRWARTVLSGRS